MDLSDLRIFSAVVHEGGITRAAERLHRVQSNVTTRIRQLEEDIGVSLFIREGKRLHLSPAGQVLLDYAGRLLKLAEEARNAVQDPRPRGLFRLGAMDSTAAVRLPGPVGEYHRMYPDVEFELRTGNPSSLSKAILAGEIDAALVTLPIAEALFEKVAGVRRRARDRFRGRHAGNRQRQERILSANHHCLRARMSASQASGRLVCEARPDARADDRNGFLSCDARLCSGRHGRSAIAEERPHHVSGKQAPARTSAAAGREQSRNLFDMAQGSGLAQNPGAAQLVDGSRLREDLGPFAG